MDNFGRLPNDVLNQIKYVFFQPKYDIKTSFNGECFSIEFQNNNITFSIHITDPLKVYLTEYSTSDDKNTEWSNFLYFAIFVKYDIF